MTPLDTVYNRAMAPRIAFVTTCKGRLQHLQETLPRNIGDNSDYPNCVFIVLSYGDPKVGDYIGDTNSQGWVWDALQSGRLVYYEFPTNEPFHMSLAKNMAMRCAVLEAADILVTVDADNFTGPGFAHFIASHMGQEGFFMCPNFPLIKSLPHGPERPQRGYAGRLAVRAQDFIKMGGYDETFDTWRGEDIDLIARMQRTEFQMGLIENRFLNAIPHGAEIRFKEYPHAQEFEEAGEWKKIMYGKSNTVVNYGRFGVGTVYRNFDPAPIALEPLPTRIFGIGMHKTGTTSLHHAFQHLGYDSLHWGNNRVAWRIWNEMNDLGRSVRLEKSYSSCDLPIPMLFRQLDKAYPGSKFILTKLNEPAWLAAVQCLWDPNRNPFYDWDKQPFSHRIHEALYGRRDFDEDTFLTRYRRHNSDVLDYFRERPADLLVMNMSKGAGWPELCGFLGKPIPNIPYPHAHKDVELPKTYWKSRDHLHSGDL